MFSQECAMKRSDFFLGFSLFSSLPLMYVCVYYCCWWYNSLNIKCMPDERSVLRFRRFQAFDCALLLCSAGVCISYCHLFTEWTFDADVKGYKQHNAIEYFFFNSLLFSISNSNCVKSQAWSLSLDLIAISFIFWDHDVEPKQTPNEMCDSDWNTAIYYCFFFLLWKTEKTTIWLNSQMITSTHHHQWTTKRIQIWMDKVSTIIWLIFKNEQQINI